MDINKELEKFKALPRKEQSAFLAWFAGGKSGITQYQSQKNNVFFGKAECEWVNFEEFWIKKLPALGWFTVKEKERFIAIGMIGKPEAIKYLIKPTEIGWAVREAFWSNLWKQ